MSNRVERLRTYLLGSAIFLLLVIIAFLGAARYIRRHSVKLLPVQMALDVLREAANPTFCQSDGRSTKFCIHAAKSVEYKSGKMVLHDASITLYGAKGDRSDHIYGDEFEYDKNTRIIRAPGIVHIDLQAAGAAAGSGQASANAKVMHVTTSGLVYVQNLGVASTSEPVEFEADGLTGHAVGADYSSDTALVSLHSAVSMSGLEKGHALAMTAATAAFDDRSQQALLTHATYESEGRKASADQATLYRRVDGTLSRIDARGNATIQANGGTAVAAHADIALTAASQPQSAVMTGGVKYSLDQPLRQVAGQADTATVQFDGETQPQPEHAMFAGSVHMTERMRATAAVNEPWSTRELKAAKVEVALARDGAGKAQVQDVIASGAPHVIAVNNGNLASNAGKGTTELAADTLSAHMAAAADPKQSPQIETIAGRGNTTLHQMSADGKEQTVTADTLDAKLRPKAQATSGTAKDKAAQSILSAVQVGHVQMMQRTPPKPGGAATGRPAGDDIEHAFADRSVYDGDTDRLTLSGGVQLNDATSELWASQVVLDHKTGDADATGGVKVSYAAESTAGNTRGQNEPAHVVADRAKHEHATDTSTFYGAPVRLWQGGNQVLAPVIAVSNAQKTLTAHGDGSAPGMTVTTVLAAAQNPAGAAKAGDPAGADGCPARASVKDASASVPSAHAVRVVSGGLAYTDATGQADFTGGFRADTADGTIRASEGIVYRHQTQLAPNGSSAHASPTISLAGDLDHIVATGRVELDKPGLKATGERLVYTASDRSALLTGDARNPPRAVGPQGTTTGYALHLLSSCGGKGSGSVEVLAGPGQRAHTDAQVNDEGKKEKAKQ